MPMLCGGIANLLVDHISENCERMVIVFTNHVMSKDLLDLCEGRGGKYGRCRDDGHRSSSLSIAKHHEWR